MSRTIRAAAAGSLLWAMLAIAPEVRAVDPYEIQVYDGTANAAGVPGLELHLNDWATGHRDATPPELPLHGQFHATLEPSFGLTPFWELGAYLQTTLRDDGGFDYAGAKLRSKFVTPPKWNEHWRLGLNFELSLLPKAYDRNRWGTEVRPIVAFDSDEWLFAFNPIFDQPLAGGDAAQGPSFEPALKAGRKVGPVALGFEYYASFGPVSALLPWRDQEHYLYEVVDVLSFTPVELNVGLGEGLTPRSAGVVVKAIVGYAFETLAMRPGAAASNRTSRAP
jgi:hypothetical protein